MDTAATRAVVARLQGLALRWASARHAPVGFGDTVWRGRGAAVADLRRATTDVVLLSRAAAVFADPAPNEVLAATAWELLVAAGADPDAAREWRAQHPPTRFRPPPPPER